MKRFLALTFAGALPWTALILYAGMMLGESWKILTQIGHEASLAFIGVMAAVVVFFYLRHRRKRKQTENVDWE